MTFYGGIFIGIMVGVIIGVITMSLMFVAKGSDEIINELYGALEEWVEINENYWNAPDFGKKRYERSCKALNRARGM
ncbi:hypothetical protein E4K67_22550 [Desulfosporosinus fructosivorans]|uniref:Uncharacterized protein n=1 Tax=Desulfosporosinus fructosivorans TaxID=2018669 RepID=A0A4Z0QZL7_9FIRM|nr:DUF3789 domain-containing protein [Desulfosporosinus fructosivorans]TGE35900.1 hypothetical protein E4K67_22550 [Desulfosporosinus fructosivorans]